MSGMGRCSQMDEVGAAVDGLDNVLAASRLGYAGMAAVLHIVGNVRERLKSLYVKGTGENPWGEFDKLAASGPPSLVDSGKGKGIPAPFQASTLRLIAGWLIVPMSCPYTEKDLENWAILLNQIADELEGG